MKAQLSMEAVYATTAVMLIFTLALTLNLDMRVETTDRLITQDDIRECADMSEAIDTIYSNGEGASMRIAVGRNVTIHAGLVEMRTGDNTYYCTIDNNAVDTATTLATGDYTIKNTGGHVEFT